MRLYSPLNTAIIASLFFVSSLAVLLTNNTCTVLANGFEVVDDSPTINDAIMKCGNGGSIVLPAGQYYSIHNSIDFSPCKSCDFQIEGTIIVAREQLNYFANYNRSVFTIANATGVRIRSVTGTGTVDGNGVDWYQRPNWSPKYGGYPFVHIRNESSDISVENLYFKNVQDRFFILQGNSFNLRFNNLRFTTEQMNPIYFDFDTVGFEMGDVSNVSITDTDMDFRVQESSGDRAMGTCIAFDSGTTDVVVQNVTCRRAWGGALIMFDTIWPHIRPLVNGSTSSISNIRVSNFTFAGDHATGVQSWFSLSKRLISNVLWEWVNVEQKTGQAASFDPCFASQRSTQYWPTCMKMVTYETRNVSFEHFRGAVGAAPSDPKWGDVGNGLMDVETHFEDWVGNM